MSHWVTGQGGTPRVPGEAAPPTPHEPTILIVGAGTFGTSTAYFLAQAYRDPSKVTVVDRADSPPKPAAAIDINRVVRTDYASPLYSNLAYESWHTWFWSSELQPYFHQSGWLMMDDSDDSSLSKAIRQQYRARGSDPTEGVKLDEIEERWGGMMKGTDVQDFKSAYYSDEVGWCDAAGATQKFMQDAEQKGVNRVTAEVAELLLNNEKSSVVGLKTADGQELHADKILIAGGAWTSSLLSPLEDTLNISEIDRAENQLRTIGVLAAYYPVSSEEVKLFEQNQMPIVIYGQKGEVIPPSSQNKQLKYTHNKSFTNTIRTKSGAKITAPTGLGYEHQVNDIPDELKREAEQNVISKVLPNFTKGKKADHWRICYDARTPTEDFLICKYPHLQNGNMYIASGGSSHSYKFLANAGKYIINVLNEKSNGEEKDKAWAWKKEGWDVRDESPDYPKLGAWTPKRELSDIGGGRSKL